MLIALLALLSSVIAPEPPIPPPPCPTAQLMGHKMGIGGDLRRNACDAELHLRAAGWSDAWVAGALTNAWFESGWRADAVGDSGHSVGFWQLRDNGLGKGMGDLRYDLRHSTRAIVRSAHRQKIRTWHGDVRSAADKFCQLIMRPSDKVRKGEQRASAAAHLSADDRSDG